MVGEARAGIISPCTLKLGKAWMLSPVIWTVRVLSTSGYREKFREAVVCRLG